MLAEIFSRVDGLAKIHCAEWGIPHYLHENDYILQYGIDRLGVDGAVHSYFHAARHEAGIITDALKRLFPSHTKIKALDFASGYGRIARHLNYFDKRIDLYTADIHPEAVSFMKDRLELASHLSNLSPEFSVIGEEYDFIYVLSLFSHLPEDLFVRWIQELYKKIKVGGYILFTTHGIKSLHSNPPFFEKFYDLSSGYGFQPISEQHDLDSATYGTTIVSPVFVLKRLEQVLPGALLYSFASGKWFGNIHQDEYIIQKC